MGEIIRFPVFRDDKGNRFVFPGLYSSSEHTVSSWAFCRYACAALKVEEEKERLVVPVDDDGRLTFPHLPASAGHPGFAHGGEDVWLIGGPEFDEAARAKGKG